jgi:hypothetical protein
MPGAIERDSDRKADQASALAAVPLSFLRGRFFPNDPLKIFPFSERLSPLPIIFSLDGMNYLAVLFKKRLIVIK